MATKKEKVLDKLPGVIRLPLRGLIAMTYLAVFIAIVVGFIWFVSWIITLLAPFTWMIIVSIIAALGGLTWLGAIIETEKAKS